MVSTPNPIGTRGLASRAFRQVWVELAADVCQNGWQVKQGRLTAHFLEVPMSLTDSGSAISTSHQHPRQGFTLVELLVVITIIALLVALTLPAIGSARESARRTECGEKMHQLALHIEAFENTANRYPGWFEFPVRAKDAAGSIYPYPWATGWIPQMLPYMQRNDLAGDEAGFINWRRPQIPGFDGAGFPTTVSVGNAAVDMNGVLCCPSDATKINFESNPSMGIFPVTSYVVNAGRVDGGATDQIPHDWPANAVFLNMRPDNLNNRVATYIAKQTKTYISSNDGLNTTLMLSERTADAEAGNLNTWSQLPVPVETVTGFLFDTVDPNPGGDFFGLAGYPSSNHPRGVNVIFAGGTLSYMSPDVDYGVYTWLMTPNGGLAKEPGTTNPSPAAIINQGKLNDDMWQ